MDGAGDHAPTGGLLREAVRILPDTLRLIRGLAADPTLPRAVRIRLAPLRSESFVPSLLSVPPGSFFGFFAPADGCFARRLVPSSPRSGPAGIGVSNGDHAPGAPISRPTATTQIYSERKVRPNRHLLTPSGRTARQQ